MSNLLEKTLVTLFSAMLLGLSLAYLMNQVMPMLRQIYESVIKLLAAG